MKPTKLELLKSAIAQLLAENQRLIEVVRRLLNFVTTPDGMDDPMIIVDARALLAELETDK